MDNDYLDVVPNKTLNYYSEDSSTDEDDESSNVNVENEQFFNQIYVEVDKIQTTAEKMINDILAYRNFKQNYFKPKSKENNFVKLHSLQK